MVGTTDLKCGMTNSIECDMNFNNVQSAIIITLFNIIVGQISKKDFSLLMLTLMTISSAFKIIVIISFTLVCPNVAGGTQFAI